MDFCPHGQTGLCFLCDRNKKVFGISSRDFEERDSRRIKGVDPKSKSHLGFWARLAQRISAWLT